MRKQYTQQDGLTLLVALLTISILLAISASLLNITLKQYRLSGIARSSETAFQAANAGAECLQYYDKATGVAGTFDVPGDGTEQASRPQITCFGQTVSASMTDDDSDGLMKSGEEQHFQFEWGGAEAVCTDVSMYKFYDEDASAPMVVNGQVVRNVGCPQGTVCTVIKARGYNTSCSGLSNNRTVERELTYVY